MLRVFITFRTVSERTNHFTAEIITSLRSSHLAANVLVMLRIFITFRIVAERTNHLTAEIITESLSAQEN